MTKKGKLSKTRKFDKENYRLIQTTATKIRANKIKKTLKNQGKKVRIVKGKASKGRKKWRIYARGK